MDGRHIVAFCAGVSVVLALCVAAVVSAGAQSRYGQMPPPPSARAGYPPVAVQRPSGPPWAMPNECYIDEGYGRFSPCR